jgi:hypothetical protein
LERHFKNRRELAKAAMFVLNILGEQLSMWTMQLVANVVPITSNYKEITLSEEIIKISNNDTIIGENILALKTNIETRMESNLQEMGWNLGNGENKIVIFKLEISTSRYFIPKQFQ